MATTAERLATLESALISQSEAIASLSTLIAASLAAPVRAAASSPVATAKAASTYSTAKDLPCTAVPPCGKLFKSSKRAASHNTATGHYAPTA